jgi:hypothetical protein
VGGWGGIIVLLIRQIEEREDGFKMVKTKEMYSLFYAQKPVAIYGMAEILLINILQFLRNIMRRGRGRLFLYKYMKNPYIF